MASVINFNPHSLFLPLFLVLAATATSTTRPYTFLPRPRVGYYGSACWNVESIVRSVVQSNYFTNPANAPGILRMHFHDCFVRGCDASILLDGPNSEKTATPNQSLRGFNVIEEAKTQLEIACPRTVSCADILALAARDFVVLTGGPWWPVPLGRLDGRVSLASNVDLPEPTDSVAVQKQRFAAKYLNTQDLVVLAAGHTIGTVGCGVFRDRFFNYKNTGRPDPTINPNFVPQIQSQCPLNGNAATRVALDLGSEGQFDTSYLNNLRFGRGVLESDQVLWNDPGTRSIVERLLGLQYPFLLFGPEFARSMSKLSLTEVKTGLDGEIRRQLRSSSDTQRKPRQLSRRTEGIKLEEVRWSGGNVGFAGQTFVMILCIVNLINYMDRGVIASNGVNGSSTPCDSKGLCSAGTGIQGEFRLSNFQDGLLSSAFMVGLLVASPIFAALSKRGCS
ncbi:Peroxidase 70 [Raphanus sativus]|nr:Peroxidase 70 [Raphanus sativus]